MSASREIATFDPAAKVRLARLLGMLGSDHDGEVANAGRLAHRLVTGCGLTWTDIVVGSAAPAKRKPRKPRAKRPPPKPPATRPPEHWHQDAEQVMQSGQASPWEQSFCASLLTQWRGRCLSDKQTEVLFRIWRERCAREAA